MLSHVLYLVLFAGVDLSDDDVTTVRERVIAFDPINSCVFRNKHELWLNRTIDLAVVEGSWGTNKKDGFIR